ncbi:MAG: hydantoinase/oxoprolinase family protein [Methanomicrobiales archaeon]
MKIAGFDVGGANTDVAIIDFNNSGEISNIEVDYKYLPMWAKKEELGVALKKLLGPHIDDLDAVGICMTAELVDAYKTKKEGVLDIAKKVKEVFKVPVGFVSVNGMVDYEKLHNNPEKVAAANWIATSMIAAKITPDCIMVDVGSTTTDIIPIKNGLECAQGRSDLERLGTGELVYSGTLRTNLATIVQQVPINNQWFRVSSELFAISADVHTVLDLIDKKVYTCDTPDGAGKSKEECMRRISRLVCGDLDVLEKNEIEQMSNYIHQEQIKQISEALLEVSAGEDIKVVGTGLGMDILAKKASGSIGLEFIGMDTIFSKEECVVAPAIGTALLMQDYLKR